ncbi:PREDICTED: uncharacterized protein LOC108369337 isoform X2 [Rhagoletis zephyria]|nr:PREDICTED: uncharacterized protein LOC108369337 isoform X2 [Rhagoletis zephyria]
MKNTQPGTSESSHLPVMPFNEKDAFDNFMKELVDKEPILNEFAILTYNLAQKFSWKGTKEKPALTANFAVTVIKGICYKKFPNSDDFYIQYYPEASDSCQEQD